MEKSLLQRRRARLWVRVTMALYDLQISITVLRFSIFFWCLLSSLCCRSFDNSPLQMHCFSLNETLHCKPRSSLPIAGLKKGIVSALSFGVARSIDCTDSRWWKKVFADLNVISISLYQVSSSLWDCTVNCPFAALAQQWVTQKNMFNGKLPSLQRPGQKEALDFSYLLTFDLLIHGPRFEGFQKSSKIFGSVLSSWSATLPFSFQIYPW